VIPRTLELYNSKGILKGLKKDKIFLDLTNYKTGIILIQGIYGSGKTTILNNLQPYRRNFTHDFLKDGYRYLEFEYGGYIYLSQVYQEKAMLFKDGILLNKTQKVKEYDQYLEEELGDEDAFCKLLFAGRNVTNILKLTKGERKDLLVDYLLQDLKKYTFYQDKLKADEERIMTKFNLADIKLERIPVLNKELEDILASNGVLEMTLEAYKEALNDVLTKQNEFIEQEENNKSKLEEIHNKELELSGVRVQLSSAESNLTRTESRISTGTVEYEEVQLSLKNLGVVSIEGLDEKYLRDEKEKYMRLSLEDTNEKSKLEGTCKSLLGQYLSKQDDYFKLKENSLPCHADLQVLCPLTKNRNIEKLIEESGKELDELEKQHEQAVETFNKYEIRLFTE